MSDPDFEPLHSGDDEDEFIQEKKRKDGVKRPKNKSGQLFKRSLEKREKGSFEPSRPITAPSPGKAAQRPVQGLVGPGDAEFGTSPPTNASDEMSKFENRQPVSSAKLTPNSSTPIFTTNSTAGISQTHWAGSKETDFSRQVQHVSSPRGSNQALPPQVVQNLPHQLQKNFSQQSTQQVQSQTVQQVTPQGIAPVAPGQQNSQVQQIASANVNIIQQTKSPREDNLTLLAKAKLYSLQYYTSQQDMGVQSQQQGNSPPRVASPVEQGPGYSHSPVFSPPPNQKGTTENQVQWSSDEGRSRQAQVKENWADFSKTFTVSTDDLYDSDDQIRRERSSSNSSAISFSSGDESDVEDSVWRITDEQRDYYTKQFRKLQPSDGGVIKGSMARDFFLKSGLPTGILSRIWHLSDLNKDHALDLDEFCIAMHLVVAVRHGVELPQSLPPLLLPKNEDVTVSPAKTPNEVSSTENLNSDDKLQSPGWANFESTTTDTMDSEDSRTFNTSTSGRRQSDSHPTAAEESSSPRGQSIAEGTLSPGTAPQSHKHHRVLTSSTSVGHGTGWNTQEKRTGMSKKHSIEIARPRAAGGLVNLMDLGPGQLLPPPGGKKGRGPPKRIMTIQGAASPMTSPTSATVPDFQPTSSQSDLSDNDTYRGKTKTEPPDEQPSAEILKENEAVLNDDSKTAEVEEGSTGGPENMGAKDTPVDEGTTEDVPLRRSSSRRSRPRSYTGDSRSSVELDHLPDYKPDTSGDLGHPPTPPPRFKKGHSRASSLDMNKLFGSKGTPLFDQSQSGEKIAKRDNSPPKKPPRTSVYLSDSLPDGDKTSSDAVSKPEQDVGTKSIIRPRPAPAGSRQTKLNHRRSASLDYGKETAALPPPKVFEGKNGVPRLFPKRAAPNPPQHKNRAKSEERSYSSRASINVEDDDRSRQTVRPSDKKMRKHELQVRIRLLKEKNSSLSSINNELNQELRQVMENRTTLELKTEKMKQTFNK